MDNVYIDLEELIKYKYPTATVVKTRGAFEIRDDEAREFSSQIDAFVYAVED